MKPGNKVIVTWVDGDQLTGVFVKKQQGFLLVRDDAGRIHPCLPSHLEKIEIIDA